MKCREVWKYIFVELEAVCIISFAVLVWSLQVHDNVLCVLWCLCVGQCQHTSTWCSMVTASFVCWLNAGMIIEVLHYEVIISCGFSSCRIHISKCTAT